MNETFEQVLSYMEEHESGNAEEAFFDSAAWRELIVRLRAAHEREVATLKAALKPVLECREEKCGRIHAERRRSELLEAAL